MKELEKKLVDIIQQVPFVCQWTEDEVKNAKNIQMDLALDSLEIVDLVCKIEKEFGVTIKDEEVEALVSGSFEHLVADVYARTLAE